jgi:hypothetical protein
LRGPILFLLLLLLLLRRPAHGKELLLDRLPYVAPATVGCAASIPLLFALIIHA